MNNKELTREIAQSLISDSSLSPREYTSITPEAARVLARDYKCKHRPSRIGVTAGFVTESKLDLSGLTLLDGESAKSLSEWGQENGAFIMELNLSGLTELTPEIAAALAAWQPNQETEDGGCGLILDGIKQATAKTLEALARWNPGCIFPTLSLKGLEALGVDEAKAIRGWAGGAGYSQLMLGGVRMIGCEAVSELVQWTGEALGLGIDALPVDVATELSHFKGHTLGLDKLTKIDIVSAQKLFNTAAEVSPGEQPPSWEMLVLGSGDEPLAGITPEVADWITSLRAAGVEVKVSGLTELTVYANSTIMEKLPEPKELNLGHNWCGRHNQAVSVVCCPFCGHKVGTFIKTQGVNDGEPFEILESNEVLVRDRVNPETWDEQWKHTPCPHVIAIICGGRAVEKIAGVTPTRASVNGRIRLKAEESGHVMSMAMVYEFAPGEYLRQENQSQPDARLNKLSGNFS